jgi:glycolate oxidase FAD binding subunit
MPGATVNFLHRANRLSPRPAMIAHAGSGIVYGHLPEGATLEAAQAALRELGQAAGESSGNVVVTRCPSAWKSVLPIWGTPRPDYVLMHAVKEKLDPQRIFNPGRFVDGI